MKKMTAIAVIAALSVGLLAGCKQTDNAAGGSAPPGASLTKSSSGYVYVPEYVQLPQEVTAVANPQLINGVLYFVDSGRLYSVGPDGTALNLIEGFTLPEVPSTAPEDAAWSVDHMVDAGGGYVWLCESGYFGYLDEDENYIDDTRLTVRKVSLSDGSTV
ncbi:MAG: hypothetical protein LBC65_04310, partial [Oscillospiraceae bacterium]|nr:hypothetical protein [Oscillospiraceae bacterium]